MSPGNSAQPLPQARLRFSVSTTATPSRSIASQFVRRVGSLRQPGCEVAAIAAIGELAGRRDPDLAAAGHRGNAGEPGLQHHRQAIALVQRRFQFARQVEAQAIDEQQHRAIGHLRQAPAGITVSLHQRLEASGLPFQPAAIEGEQHGVDRPFQFMWLRDRHGRTGSGIDFPAKIAVVPRCFLRIASGQRAGSQPPTRR